MIEVLAAIGGGSTCVLAIVLAIVVYKLVDAVNSERASLAAETLAEKAQNAMQLQRDAAIVGQKRAEAERDDMAKQLAAANARAAELADEKAKQAKEEIDAASGDNLVALSHSVLGAQPQVQAPAATAAGDHDPPGTVQRPGSTVSG